MIIFLYFIQIHICHYSAQSTFRLFVSSTEIASAHFLIQITHHFPTPEYGQFQFNHLFFGLKIRQPLYIYTCISIIYSLYTPILTHQIPIRYPHDVPTIQPHSVLPLLFLIAVQTHFFAWVKDKITFLQPLYIHCMYRYIYIVYIYIIPSIPIINHVPS